MIERIVAGATPTCRLSRRAELALAHIRERFDFVDAESVTIVSTATGLITVWAFAGGVGTASIADGLAAQGLAVVNFDDFSFTIRSPNIDLVVKSLRSINPVSVHPKLPINLSSSLKFGLCLPDHVIERVLAERMSDKVAVIAALQRPLRFVSILK